MRDRSDLQCADRENGPLALDLYVPERESPTPLVVVTHGGFDGPTVPALVDGFLDRHLR